jgi:hypothetical protein
VDAWTELKRRAAEAVDRAFAEHVARREARSARRMGAKVCPLSEHVDYMHARLEHPAYVKCPGCGAAL